MTPDERARAEARIDMLLDKLQAAQERSEAKAEDRLRQKIKTHLAVEQLHQANATLREALSRLESAHR